MTIETNTWTNPRNGETRYYINNPWKILGLEVERYNTGNIRHASIDGEKIANGRASRLSGKLWADVEGNLHLDYFNGDIFYTKEEALERIAKYIAENGGLDFLKEEAEEEAAAGEQQEDKEITEDIELTEEEIALIESDPEPSPRGVMRTRNQWAALMARKIAMARDVDSAEIFEAYVKAKGGKPDPLLVSFGDTRGAIVKAFHEYFEEV